MAVHRIAKRAGTLLAAAGASPNTVGIVYDTTSAEGILKVSVDGTNFRKIEDGHMGAAAETANASSLVIASQQQSNAGIGNAADTTDDTLFTYALPANALNVAGKSIGITAWGKTAANGNNKTIKVKFGGTTVLTSGVVTSNNLAWYAYCEVVKTASNAQVIFSILQIGTTISVQTVTTATETDTAAINVTVTGASGTTGAANDVLGNNLTVEFGN